MLDTNIRSVCNVYPVQVYILNGVPTIKYDPAVQSEIKKNLSTMLNLGCTTILQCNVERYYIDVSRKKISVFVSVRNSS